MSIDIIVNLPLETHSKEIFLFVSKLAGSEFEIKPNDGKSVVDFSKPCDKNNCWTYQIKYEIKVDDLSSAQLFFEDTLKQKHRWYFSAENESLEHKKFLMSSHALGAVIGKRLVDFFGGSLQYTDYSDDIHYECTNSKYKKIKGNENINSNYYQFYNLLKAEPDINATELIEATKLVGYPKEDRSLALIDFLSKKDLMESLNLNIDTTTNNKKYKI